MSSNVEKDIYSLDKNYTEVVFSKKRPPLDFEFNEAQKIQGGLRQQFNRAVITDGPYGDGFLVEGTGNPNEIRIRSGLLAHSGHNLYLPDDIIVGSLTTPSGGDRTDAVYIEWHFREVDSVEDPNIIDVTNVGIETAVRQKLEIEILVSEGGFVPAPAPGYYQYPICTMNRLDTIALIDSTQTVDTRAKSGLNYVSTGGKVLHTTLFNYSFEGATGLVAGSQFNLPNSLSSVGANEIRFLYVSDAEILTLAASLPTSYHVPLARITSNNTTITSVLDLRRFSPMATSGSGGTQSVFTMTALNPLLKYQIVKVVGVNTIDLTDASAEASMPVWAMVLDDANIGELTRVMTSGTIENPLWSFVAGSQLYGSETAGEITSIAPSTVSSVIQKIGIALTPTNIYFNPDLTYDVVGGVSSHAQNTDLGTTSDTFTLRYGSGVAIATPATFRVNRGVGLPVDIRYNPTGNKWEITDDGVTFYDLNLKPFFASILGADAIGVDTTSFSNNLTALDNTVQKALETLDALVASGGSGFGVDFFTLNAGDITNKYKDLSQLPVDPLKVVVHLVGGSTQYPATDYNIITNGSDLRRLNWSALGLQGSLISGSKLVVVYPNGIPDPIPATMVTLDTTNFTSVLSGADIDVQLAMDTIDNLTAADVPTNTVSFNNNLSPTDDTVQKALDTLDNMILTGGGTRSEVRKIAYVDVTGSVLTNKYFDLANVPVNQFGVKLHVIGGTTQRNGIDFRVQAASPSFDVKRVYWDSLRGDTEISINNNELAIEYTVFGSPQALKEYSVTVDATIFANEYFDLPETPADVNTVLVQIVGGSAQRRLVDYTVLLGNRISWGGLRIDTLAQAPIGTQFIVSYGIASSEFDYRVKTENFTVDDALLTAGSYDLAYPVADPTTGILVEIIGGTAQRNGSAYDYVVEQGADNLPRLKWDTYGMDPLVSKGTEINITYGVKEIQTFNKIQEIELFTLSVTEAAAKQIRLNHIPIELNKIILEVRNLNSKYYGDDYVRSAVVGEEDTISWNGLGLDGSMPAGTKVRVLYYRGV